VLLLGLCVCLKSVDCFAGERRHWCARGKPNNSTLSCWWFYRPLQWSRESGRSNVCIRTATFELNDLWSRYLAYWFCFLFDPVRRSRSHRSNFTITRNMFILDYTHVTTWNVFGCLVSFCAKLVGATSSDRSIVYCIWISFHWCVMGVYLSVSHSSALKKTTEFVVKLFYRWSPHHSIFWHEISWTNTHWVAFSGLVKQA